MHCTCTLFQDCLSNDDTFFKNIEYLFKTTMKVSITSACISASR